MVGWWARARFKKPGSDILISDKKYGGKEKAYSIAKSYVDDYNRIFNEERVVRIFHRHPSKTNKTSGIAGVSFCSSRGSGCWQAGCPGGPHGDKPAWHKQYHVGVWGFEEAKSRATAFRKLWEQHVLDDELDKFWACVGSRMAGTIYQGV